MTRPALRVLFVCTGNICRSPTAEGVFRHLAAEAGLNDAFHIESAGTEDYHEGEPPDHRTVKKALEKGVDLSRQRARQVKDADFSGFDYIYAMDSGHHRILTKRAPKASKAKLSMFRADGEDVPDPWYGTEKDFENVYVLVHENAGALLKKLREDHKI
ncbi:MAG: low molecular weight protein-tyrosine-phosphatase [Alphaproteobacteria bacterium]